MIAHPLLNHVIRRASLLSPVCHDGNNHKPTGVERSGQRANPGSFMTVMDSILVAPRVRIVVTALRKMQVANRNFPKWILRGALAPGAATARYVKSAFSKLPCILDGGDHRDHFQSSHAIRASLMSGIRPETFTRQQLLRDLFLASRVSCYLPGDTKTGCPLELEKSACKSLGKERPAYWTERPVLDFAIELARNE
jgi:hypothetical protein